MFGELNAKLESEKAEGVRELREASKDYLSVKERTGSVTREGSYTTGHLFWKKTHHYTYEEHYSYCIAADAIENLGKYALDASNQVEEVFTDALQIKEIKRKLLNVVVNNFDMGSEKYDSSLFRIMVEETVSGKFSGELTSASQKTELSTALSKAISRIYDEICNKLASSVKIFRDELTGIGNKVQDNLLTNITEEFETLLAQCENKDNEIAGYKEYVAILDKEIKAIR